MKCSTQHAFRPEEVMAYLDGELEPSRANALAGHLEHCEECQMLATQFRRVSERLLEFEVEGTPAKLNAAIVGAIPETEGAKRTGTTKLEKARLRGWPLGFASPYTWVFGCLLILAVVVIFGTPNLLRLGEGARSATDYSITTNEEVSPSFTDRSTGLSSGRLARPGVRAKIVRPGGGGSGSGGGIASGTLNAPAPAGPMIAETVSFVIVVNNYDQASAAVDRLAASQGGYVQKLSTSDHIAAAREFSATVQVPAAQLGGFLAELRKLGHVEQETRTNEEVTDQYVDLQARIKSARASEQRMLDLLATRTGKLEDVLDAERELARIREEIESMEGQRNLLAHRVSYATVEIQLREEYREQLHTGASSTATGLRNSLVEGLSNLEDGFVGLLVFLFAYGPSILFWCALFLVPGYFIWRWARSRSHE
jgi:hypothetical protein